jgi:hypothetical protein
MQQEVAQKNQVEINLLTAQKSNLPVNNKQYHTNTEYKAGIIPVFSEFEQGF